MREERLSVNSFLIPFTCQTDWCIFGSIELIHSKHLFSPGILEISPFTTIVYKSNRPCWFLTFHNHASQRQGSGRSLMWVLPAICHQVSSLFSSSAVYLPCGSSEISFSSVVSQYYEIFCMTGNNFLLIYTPSFNYSIKKKITRYWTTLYYGINNTCELQ